MEVKTTEKTKAGTLFAVTWPAPLAMTPLCEVQISTSVIAKVYETKRWVERHVDGKDTSVEVAAYKVTFTSTKTGRTPKALESHNPYNGGRGEGFLTLLSARLHIEEAVAIMTPKSKVATRDEDPED